MSTLLEKTTQNKTSIEGWTSQTTPALPAAYNNVIAALIANAQQSLEKAIERAELENLVQTATLRENGGKLNDIGEGRGIYYRYATAAVLNIQIVATDGTEITPTYSLSGDDNGLDYLVPGSYTATGGVISLPVTCTKSGSFGNLNPGDTLTLSATLAGATNVANVISTATVGASAEGIDIYRQRILDEIRNPGEAGNLSFYRKRGRNASGVAQIYPYRGEISGTMIINPGDVTIFVEATTDIDPDGIPTTAVLDAAEDAITLDSTGQIDKLPTTVRELHVEPITRSSVYFIITGLEVYDDSQLGDCQSDINDALDSELAVIKPFIPGLDYLRDKKDTLTKPNLAGIADDVARAYGGKFAALSFGFAPGVVSLAYTLSPGELVKRGGTAFV
jgi:hypothetical protein